MEPKKARKAIDSVFTPVGRKDRLVTVRFYKRTADEYDRRVVAVAVYKRPNRDLSRVAAASVETEYCKIGEVPFSISSDATGPLFFHVDSAAGSPHLRALLKLGITAIRVTSYGPDRGSENSRRAGLSVQDMTVTAGGMELPYTRVSCLGDWWETLDNQAAIFDMRSEYRWGDMPVVWVAGLTLDAIRADQDAAAQVEVERRLRRSQAAGE